MLKNKKAYLVESFSDYTNFMTIRGTEKNVIYVSTSPYIINETSKLSSSVFPLEKLVSFRELKIIDHFSISLSEEILRAFKFKDLAQFFENEVFRSISVYVYKTFLIDKLIKEGVKSITIIKNQKEEVQTDTLLPARFDYLFAKLISIFKRAPIPIEIYQLKNKNKAFDLETEIKFEENNLITKILSCLGNKLSVTLFKIYFRFFNKFCNNTKKNLYIYKSTDILKENFLKIIFDGWNINFVSPMNLAPVECTTIFSKDTVINKNLLEFENISDDIDLDKNILLGLIDFLIDRINLICSNFNKNKLAKKNIIYKTLNSIPVGSILLTNVLNKPNDRLFGKTAVELGYKVVLLQHGLTFSRSASSFEGAKFSGYRRALFGIYFTRDEGKVFSKLSPQQKVFISGVPKTLYSKSNFLKRGLSRILSKVYSTKKIIFFISRIEHGNYRYPFSPTDFQTYNFNRDIISYLAKKFSNDIIVVKLYPTTRYKDSYFYEDLCTTHKNILINRHVDFRYLRHCADYIFTNANQSTLSWIAGSNNAKCYYINYPKYTNLVKKYGSKSFRQKIQNHSVTQIQQEYLNDNKFSNSINFTEILNKIHIIGRTNEGN